MAKRELSSTLKNLKFMQRNAIKEDKEMEVEPFKPVADFGAPPAPARRCIVIMEGDPQPEASAITGRMSFQNFNPCIDKLNEETAKNHQNAPHTSNIGGNSERVDAASPLSSKRSKGGGSKNIADVGGLKRKEPDEEATDRTQKSREISWDDGGQTSSSNRCRKGTNKQRKRENLDWNVLRPPKSNKKG